MDELLTSLHLPPSHLPAYNSKWVKAISFTNFTLVTQEKVYNLGLGYVQVSELLNLTFSLVLFPS